MHIPTKFVGKIPVYENYKGITYNYAYSIPYYRYLQCTLLVINKDTLDGFSILL